MLSPKQAKRMYHGYYYSGDCSDPSVQRAIKKAFRDNFYQARRKLSVCTVGNTCNLDRVSVTCGESGGRRHRRSLPVAGVDAELLLELGVNGTGRFINGTEEIAAAIDEIVDSIREISPSVLREVSGRENMTVLMDLIDSSAEDVVIVCADGETHNAQGCAACSPGTFSRDGLETCRACPLGMYQDEPQQARCKRCPPGSTTEAFGSVSAADCKEYCKPGTHSFSGLQPCKSCEKGTYQGLSGQKSCAPCPARTTTLQEGSNSHLECVDEY
ncbi:hypothetical protein HPB49_005856 [Dermacentor silvarum]|uniref:Uncharacterized protein n=1 Tax=Dermacentor silvarum TaxID=543639 RepID=A0ACB8CVL5_DERSI|nr:hypothetical protein HPB49_005856 [Dermacentor silvarum]